MARIVEKAKRNPRTIALEKNQRKPAGEPNYCGVCGNTDCICKQYKEHLQEGRSAESSSGGKKSFK